MKHFTMMQSRNKEKLKYFIEIFVYSIIAYVGSWIFQSEVTE